MNEQTYVVEKNKVHDDNSGFEDLGLKLAMLHNVEDTSDEEIDKPMSGNEREIEQLKQQLEEEKQKHEVMVQTLKAVVGKLEECQKNAKRQVEEAEVDREKHEQTIKQLRTALKRLERESGRQLASTKQAVEDTKSEAAQVIDRLEEEKERICSEFREENERICSEFQERERALTEKHEEELAQVSEQLDKDECVLRLRADNSRLHNDLEAIRRDFDMYRRHANSLLARERTLNAAVRAALTKGGFKVPDHGKQ